MRRILVVLVLLVLMLLVGDSVGTATNWGWYTAGGNSTVEFDQYYLNDSTHNAFHFNDDYSVEPTDISTYLTHNNENHEVRINDYYYGKNGYSGWYECHNLSGDGQVCWRGHAHINLTYTETYSYTGKRWVVCQEIGHSIGLRHSGSLRVRHRFVRA